MSPRGRGRGRGKGRGGSSAGGGAGKDGKEMKVTCMSFPVTERDEETVKCKLCKISCTFREFRIHNMQNHSNIATTTDETIIPDHKFYERRLKELAKFTKAVKFKCPTEGCDSLYRSCLGLAYHLETCGKTEEEIEICLTACDVCGLKFTLPNLRWHKNSHLPPSKVPEEDNNTDEVPREKRISALKAQKMLKENVSELLESNTKGAKQRSRRKDEDEEDEWDADKEISAFEIEFGKEKSEMTKSKIPRSKQLVTPAKYAAGVTSSSKNDFTLSAFKFINFTPNTSFWDTPPIYPIDQFENITQNPWTSLSLNLIKDYLPKHKKSIEFKTEVELHQPKLIRRAFPKPKGPSYVNSSSISMIVKPYRSLSWFSGEMVDEGTGNLVFNCGGPVLSLSWHPNGKLLAVSIGRDPHEDIDYKTISNRKSCVQIYSHFYKEPNKPTEEDSNPINSLVLQLIICSDFGYATNIQWGSYWPKLWDTFSDQQGTFKGNTPKTNRIGNIACSQEDGTIRIYLLTVGDMHSLRELGPKFNESKLPMFKKIPEICLKVDESVYINSGQVCKFDWHEKDRFLVAGYCSGIVAIFDLQTKSNLLKSNLNEEGQKYVCINPFWVFQAHVGPITGVHFDPVSPRYFFTASKDRYLKVWDMDMRQETESRKIGLIVDTCWIRGWIHFAVAVDASISNLSSQYNFVRFYHMGNSQGKPNCAECFDISSLSFHNGITIQATENGNITSTYFDQFWRECDYERNKKKHNVVHISKVSLDKSSFQELTQEEFSSTGPHYVPYEFKSEEPRITLKFLKDRLKGSAVKEPDTQYFEDYIRFMPYIRINKVRWCPQGKYFATGYRNGLLTIIPATFASLYGS